MSLLHATREEKADTAKASNGAVPLKKAGGVSSQLMQQSVNWLQTPSARRTALGRDDPVGMSSRGETGAAYSKTHAAASPLSASLFHASM